jgi:3'(2'), 5'-bisphosphate nucleotidase
MNELSRTLLEIAREAAREILDVYERPFDVDYKGPHDPITEADRRSNDLICARLRALYPDLPVVAEESPEGDWQHYRNSDRVFFVDPLDGTREFVARTDAFVVMIGLLEGDRPTHGVLYAPVARRAWIGERAVGAWEVSPSGEVRELRMSPSATRSSTRVASSRSHPDSLLERAIACIGPESVEPIYSAGLKAAAVASGEADVYLAPESAGFRWDSCAPEAIVSAAGGRYTDAFGRALDYRAPRLENDAGIVAAAEPLHARVIESIASLMATR